MADSFDSDHGGAAEIQRGLAETTLEAPFHGKLQSSKCSGSFTPAHTENPFNNFENNGERGGVVPVQECTFHGVVEESDAYETVLAQKPDMGVEEIEENISAAKQEEELVKCSMKCATEIQVSEGAEHIESALPGNGKFNNDGNSRQDEELVKCSMKCGTEIQVTGGAELIESALLGNGNFNNDEDSSKRDMKQQELKEKRVKKPRRRGGKRRKNKEVLNCYFNERRENKGLQYSREEMEALRFEKLEEQKKKWIEVYCGLSPSVAEEYDGLAELDTDHQKDSVPSFDFDPRLQFQTSANLGGESPLFADNHRENLSTSDPSSSLPVTDEIGFSDVEEEFCEDDDDSDEDYSSIHRPAFLVTGEPDFDSGPPQDGLEYLRRVRWEAARIPKVKVAKGKVNKIKEQSPYMPQIPDVMKCPENLLPLKQWEDSFLADFSELRQAFMRLDLQGSSGESSIKLGSADEDIFGRMLEGNNTFGKFVSLTSMDDPCPSKASCMLETSDAESKPDSPENSSSTVDRPTLSAILKMSSVARTSMLKRRISAIENMSRLPHNEILWLFALCVAVDCPLDADTSAAIRSLLRKCASLRAAKTEVDDEVIILNILVTISGRYFGQLER